MATIPGLVYGNFEDCPVHKISARDTNKFVLLCDRTEVPFVSFVEIFDVGGRTPSNEHQEASEYFYVLKGTGLAKVGEFETPLKQGSFVIVPPGNHHDIINTGDEKLYTLTTMIPDERFSDLIKAGPKASLDEDDLQVLKAAFAG
ncbi:cupin domain-containing protein [Paenibacillus protaetiae]|uniref:Cupin domain-containing protein n=1 Tax=Paenibacillus protaetiae TaxID=2509456 RepID=A0A4P6EVB6_9BACL|nr:cupin domain-containing protein [Paenibacillus protaetiae]QAY66455.1 cupin domain-containing protein [Paenibacillus protaetiae]